jgi:HTH-type transcriptional regulator / antitoxin HigA
MARTQRFSFIEGYDTFGVPDIPHTEAEYEYLVNILDSLIDQIGEDETHPLASLMEVIGALIENYENEHIPELL